MKRVILSWSSGKDCAWTLHQLRQRPDFEVVGLLTTFDDAFDRVGMHAVRRSLVEAQAAATGLPLQSVSLPWPCSNADYEDRMRVGTEQMLANGIRYMAFGDLFLEDVRAYRERQMAGTGIEPLFPLWGTAADTQQLAKEMQSAGLRAVLTCVDPMKVPPTFAGREWDAKLIANLPTGTDPCGEHGEFHTFCFAGPMFTDSIAIKVGDVVHRDGFVFADLVRGENLNTTIQPLVEGVDYTIENGRWVFTAAYHQMRGYCCNNDCQNCPFGSHSA